MKIKIISAFPNAFSYLNESIIKNAKVKGKVHLEIINLLDFGVGRWKKIDDKPFGGGAGMVIGVEPIYNALKSLNIEPLREKRQDELTKIIITSTKGETWTQSSAKTYSNFKELIIVCGHYKGIDSRVIEYFVDFEVSIGNYILSGGELPAMVITDSIVRLIPGVLGNIESIKDETKYFADYKINEYPVYTRPEVFKAGNMNLYVPKILLSGNHKDIIRWREDQKERKQT